MRAKAVELTAHAICKFYSMGCVQRKLDAIEAPLKNF